jgi:hypothetical protein
MSMSRSSAAYATVGAGGSTAATATKPGPPATRRGWGSTTSTPPSTQAGVVVDLWKVAGERRVIAIVDVDSHDTLDEISLTLPIMVEMGQHVTINVSALRRYEDFAGNVNKLLQS